MYWFSILRLFEQYGDTLIQLPTAAKTIITASLAIMIVSSIVRQAGKFLRIAVVVAAVYFATVYLHIL